MKILITGLLISTMAFSMLDRSVGDWGSGGGNAIVCFNSATIAEGENTINILDKIKKNKNIIPDKFLSHIKSIEMYDLYEAKKRRGLDSEPAEILEIKTNETYYGYIERLGNRFERTNPQLNAYVIRGKELLPDSRVVFNKFPVDYQNDLGAVSLPGNNCLISTIAAQVNYNNFYEAHIDQRLFQHEKHSRQSKATLILHELVYATMRRYFKHQDSGITRNLVRMLLSYSKLQTERLVAENLYSMKLFSGEFESEIVNKFKLSNIMYITSVYMDILIEDLHKISESKNVRLRLNTLVEKIRELAKLQGLRTEDSDWTSYHGISGILNKGFYIGRSKFKWQKLIAEFSKVKHDSKLEVKARLEENLFSLKIELRETYISKSDKDNLFLQISSYLKSKGFNFGQYFDGAYMLDQLYSIKDNRESFKRDLFNSIINHQTCENNICFENVLLNNVIPRR